MELTSKEARPKLNMLLAKPRFRRELRVLSQQAFPPRGSHASAAVLQEGLISADKTSWHLVPRP
ncbi:hypothetical protein ARTHRO9V_200081 [Arthrobacter sp. 9V]|nr:hypothetical protein ARTHRO9V_200081 [Arthrobacter sp. 9V]